MNVYMRSIDTVFRYRCILYLHLSTISITYSAHTFEKDLGGKKKKSKQLSYLRWPVVKVNPDKLRNLAPAFVKEGGTVTAGNSSIIADGAAALVLVSAERASKLGLKVRPSLAGGVMWQGSHRP